MKPSPPEQEMVACSTRFSRMRRFIARHKGLLLAVGAGVLAVLVLRGGYLTIWKAKEQVGNRRYNL